jgi:hypothetical protein
MDVRRATGGRRGLSWPPRTRPRRVDPGPFPRKQCRAYAACRRTRSGPWSAGPILDCADVGALRRRRRRVTPRFRGKSQAHAGPTLLCSAGDAVRWSVSLAVSVSAESAVAEGGPSGGLFPRKRVRRRAGLAVGCFRGNGCGGARAWRRCVSAESCCIGGPAWGLLVTEAGRSALQPRQTLFPRKPADRALPSAGCRPAFEREPAAWWR